ncbi:MAG: yciB [Burkholderiaceae bacterium]|nr:yciB [Burkholderiaceae bacterium]
MKILIDFLAVIAFFVAYKWSNDMLFAVKIAIAATAIQMVWMKLAKIPLKPMHWFGLVSVFVFGGMGIFFNNPKFFQWKFSILEWCMGAAILIGQLGFGKNMLQLLMGNELILPEPIWRKMAWLWGGFFIGLGCLNWWVFTYYNYDVWVNFKTFWAFGLTVAFVIGQGVWVNRYLPKDEQ